MEKESNNDGNISQFHYNLTGYESNRTEIDHPHLTPSTCIEVLRNNAEFKGPECSRPVKLENKSRRKRCILATLIFLGLIVVVIIVVLTLSIFGGKTYMVIILVSGIIAINILLGSELK